MVTIYAKTENEFVKKMREIHSQGYDFMRAWTDDDGVVDTPNDCWFKVYADGEDGEQYVYWTFEMSHFNYSLRTKRTKRHANVPYDFIWACQKD